MTSQHKDVEKNPTGCHKNLCCSFWIPSPRFCCDSALLIPRHWPCPVMLFSSLLSIDFTLHYFLVSRLNISSPHQLRASPGQGPWLILFLTTSFPQPTEDLELYPCTAHFFMPAWGYTICEVLPWAAGFTQGRTVWTSWTAFHMGYLHSHGIRPKKSGTLLWIARCL